MGIGETRNINVGNLGRSFKCECVCWKLMIKGVGPHLQGEEHF